MTYVAPTSITPVPTAALSLAPILKAIPASSIEQSKVVLYFVNKKYSDSECSVLITGTSTGLDACLPALTDSGYTRTTSTAKYATLIAYSDSWCTVASSTAKTTFLSDSCSFDASSGYIKTAVTSTPTFASFSEGVIVR